LPFSRRYGFCSFGGRMAKRTYRPSIPCNRYNVSRRSRCSGKGVRSARQHVQERSFGQRDIPCAVLQVFSMSALVLPLPFQLAWLVLVSCTGCLEVSTVSLGGTGTDAEE
jgi:hypothetical protein